MTQADYYEGYWDKGGSGYRPVQSGALASVFDRYFPTGDADCLDLGCGDGRAAGVHLSEHARSYIGVDVSATAVEQAQAIGIRAQTITDAAVLPFADASFDFVACIEVFEHLFSTEETARAVRRVLRPNGVVFIQVPNVAHWRNRLSVAAQGRFVADGDLESLSRPWRDPHIRFFTLDSLALMCEHVGLEVAERRGIGNNQLLYMPKLHRFARSRRPGVLSRALIARRPTLFANRLQVIARRS